MRQHRANGRSVVVSFYVFLQKQKLRYLQLGPESSRRYDSTSYTTVLTVVVGDHAPQWQGRPVQLFLDHTPQNHARHLSAVLYAAPPDKLYPAISTSVINGW